MSFPDAPLTTFLGIPKETCADAFSQFAALEDAPVAVVEEGRSEYLPFIRP